MSNLITRIETILKEKGCTFNRAEHDLGLGNGTIKRWGEQSPRLDKLVKVAEYLDTSLDYLVFGTLHSDSSQIRESTKRVDALKIEQGLTCDGSPLEEEECDLIAMYRLLPTIQRHEIYDYVFFKYQRFSEWEKGYSSSGYTAGKGRSGPGDDLDVSAGTA
ncbi:XRE family transcriptional regulator [Dysosmobacter sp.]